MLCPRHSQNTEMFQILFSIEYNILSSSGKIVLLKIFINYTISTYKYAKNAPT